MSIIEKIDKVLEEGSVSPAKVQKEVDKVKAKLIKKWASKGAYENFGQKEVRALKDKFEDSSDYGSEMKSIRSIIDRFDDWASSYDG